MVCQRSSLWGFFFSLLVLLADFFFSSDLKEGSPDLKAQIKVQASP